MREAELKMSMGGQVVRSGHIVGSVVAGHIDDASDRLKPDSTTYYRAGQASIPPVFSDRLVSELNTVLLDSLYRELRKVGHPLRLSGDSTRPFRPRSVERSSADGWRRILAVWPPSQA
jgi:hypothetical protein